ncbi:MAG: hypothetical protein HYT46_03030 [Candidatus Vogelbacteria bacterium]|nr:hypothetical protein [Candidatus Vogelbacteria bacterium]
MARPKFFAVFKTFSIVWLILALALLPSPSLAVSGVPTILSYQGRLTNAAGDLLGGSGTTYYFKFSIWDNATVGSGTKLWPTSDPSSVSASVRQGVFNVNIGDTANGYPDALTYDFNTNNVIYLEVRVSSDNSSFQTLSPRQLVSAAAFAELASRVSGTSTSAFGTTTALANTQVTVEATTTTAILLTLRAASGQSANLFQIQNAGASNLLYVAAAGGLFASSTLQVTGQTTLYGSLFVNNATSTITNLTMVNSTSTNATTTSHHRRGRRQFEPRQCQHLDRPPAIRSGLVHPPIHH